MPNQDRKDYFTAYSGEPEQSIDPNAVIANALNEKAAADLAANRAQSLYQAQLGPTMESVQEALKNVYTDARGSAFLKPNGHINWAQNPDQQMAFMAQGALPVPRDQYAKVNQKNYSEDGFTAAMRDIWGQVKEAPGKAMLAVGGWLDRNIPNAEEHFISAFNVFDQLGIGTVVAPLLHPEGMKIIAQHREEHPLKSAIEMGLGNIPSMFLSPAQVTEQTISNSLSSWVSRKAGEKAGSLVGAAANLAKTNVEAIAYTLPQAMAHEQAMGRDPTDPEMLKNVVKWTAGLTSFLHLGGSALSFVGDKVAAAKQARAVQKTLREERKILRSDAMQAERDIRGHEAELAKVRDQIERHDQKIRDLEGTVFEPDTTDYRIQQELIEREANQRFEAVTRKAELRAQIDKLSSPIPEIRQAIREKMSVDKSLSQEAARLQTEYDAVKQRLYEFNQSEVGQRMPSLAKVLELRLKEVEYLTGEVQEYHTLLKRQSILEGQVHEDIALGQVDFNPRRPDINPEDAAKAETVLKKIQDDAATARLKAVKDNEALGILRSTEEVANMQSQPQAPEPIPTSSPFEVSKIHPFSRGGIDIAATNSQGDLFVRFRGGLYRYFLKENASAEDKAILKNALSEMLSAKGVDEKLVGKELQKAIRKVKQAPGIGYEKVAADKSLKIKKAGENKPSPLAPVADETLPLPEPSAKDSETQNMAAPLTVGAERPAEEGTAVLPRRKKGYVPEPLTEDWIIPPDEGPDTARLRKGGTTTGELPPVTPAPSQQGPGTVNIRGGKTQPIKEVDLRLEPVHVEQTEKVLADLPPVPEKPITHADVAIQNSQQKLRVVENVHEELRELNRLIGIYEAKRVVTRLKNAQDMARAEMSQYKASKAKQSQYVKKIKDLEGVIQKTKAAGGDNKEKLLFLRSELDKVRGKIKDIKAQMPRVEVQKMEIERYLEKLQGKTKEKLQGIDDKMYKEVILPLAEVRKRINAKVQKIEELKQVERNLQKDIRPMYKERALLAEEIKRNEGELEGLAQYFGGYRHKVTVALGEAIGKYGLIFGGFSIGGFWGGLGATLASKLQIPQKIGVGVARGSGAIGKLLTREQISDLQRAITDINLGAFIRGMVLGARDDGAKLDEIEQDVQRMVGEHQLVQQAIEKDPDDRPAITNMINAVADPGGAFRRIAAGDATEQDLEMVKRLYPSELSKVLDAMQERSAAELRGDDVKGRVFYQGAVQMMDAAIHQDQPRSNPIRNVTTKMLPSDAASSRLGGR